MRALAATGSVACCLHGQAEAVAAFHRKLREGAIDQKELAEILAQFQKDSANAGFQWLPLTPLVVGRVTKVYGALPQTALLRAADAIHLGCAAEAGFNEIYSNDRRLLEAAPSFGINGRNIL